MNQEDWLKYVPAVGAGIAIVGFVALGIQNAVLAGQVSQLSAEVTALHEFVAKDDAARPAPSATAMRRTTRPPGAPGAAAGVGRRPGAPPARPGAAGPGAGAKAAKSRPPGAPPAPAAPAPK
jgi:hypothetical protein